MSKHARSKLPAPSTPAPQRSMFRSRPFVDETQTKQPAGRASPSHHGSSLAPTRGFADEAAHDPASFIVQPKLSLGSAGDAYEEEADRVAAHAASGFSGSGGEMPRPMLKLQRLSTIGRITQVPPEVETGIQRARSGGLRIAPNLRAPMERAIGADFSDVRVHTDAQADQLNRSIHARAFTVGRNVFFRAGQYHPTDEAGMQILAHELTHVVQQTGCVVQQPSQTEAKQLENASTAIVGRSPTPHANHGKDGFVQRLFFEGEYFDEKSIPLDNLQTLIIRKKLRGDRPERIRHYENILKDREDREKREDGKGIPKGDRWSEMNESTMSSKQLEYVIRKTEGRDVERFNALKGEQKRRKEESEEKKSNSNLPLDTNSNSTFQAIFGVGVVGAPSRAAPPSAIPRSLTVLTRPVQFRAASTVAEASRAIDLFYCFKRDYRNQPTSDDHGNLVSVTMILKKQYMSSDDLGSSYLDSGYGESYSMGPGAQWVVHVHRMHAGNLRPPNNKTGIGWCTLQHIDQEGTETGKQQLDNAKVLSLGIPPTSGAPDAAWFKSKFDSKTKKRK